MGEVSLESIRLAYYTPPHSHDVEDVELPTHCQCGCFLPRSWTLEDDGEEVSLYHECRRCGYMNVVTLARRGR